jgi:hypothetical protein
VPGRCLPLFSRIRFPSSLCEDSAGTAVPARYYREWLHQNARENSSGALETYLAESANAEGWTGEFKAAARDANYSVREAVAALHNTIGGEVFLGVSNSGTVEGSTVRQEALNETLRQRRAAPASWRTTDLLQVTANITKVDLPGGVRCAYVIEVRPSDLPAFVLDRSEGLVLPVRSGSDTKVLDAASAIEWNSQRRRAEILRSCYKELCTFALQLSQYRPLPEGLPDPLPYTNAVIQDGSAYTILTAEDRAALFGAGAQNGRATGAVDSYYRAIRLVRDALSRRPEGYRNVAIRDLEGLASEFANLEGERTHSVETLGRYIRAQGFALESQSYT